MRAPTVLLCPDAALRHELQRAVVDDGGAFVRVVDWPLFAGLLDERLRTPFAPPIEEAERVLAVEESLARDAASRPALKELLAADPFGVAASLLTVADLLRAHGWTGPLEAPPRDDAGALVRSHLETLASVIRSVEARLTSRAELDVIGRLRRALAALRGGARSGIEQLVVEGVDRLDPLQRDVLRALEERGCAVEVAPWVQGWSGAPGARERVSAETLLGAIQRRAFSVSRADDDSVALVRPEDPAEEAEVIARWIAEWVARGADPARFAVSVGASPGAADRVRRALLRCEVPVCGGARVPVVATPLWQIVRAAVRLGWRGVDALELSTVLAAPGAGIWGGDRDRLIAELRSNPPATWRGVREIVRDLLSGDEAPRGSEGELVLPKDEERAKRLAATRERLEELIDVFEGCGPFSRHAAIDRRGLLCKLLEEVRSRFLRVDRYASAITDPRVQTTWLGAAQSIDSAIRAQIHRVATRHLTLSATDPSGFLSSTEALLGEVVEDLAPPVVEGVEILDAHASPRARPAVLLVTGFVRGRHPSMPAPPVLLGEGERAAVNAALPASEQLPSPDDDVALAIRATWRLFALPTERLVLSAPRRDVLGAATEVSLTWIELTSRMHSETRDRLQRAPVMDGARWMATSFDALLTRGSLRREAGRLLGGGRVDAALALAAPISRERAAQRDFFAARLRPERAYVVGDLVKERLREAVFSVRNLEAALTCRYRFLGDALLGLRPQRVSRRRALSAADRARVARAALRRIDAWLAERGRVGDDDVERAVEASIEGRPLSTVEESELRRSTLAFVQRYLTLRRDWSAREGVDLDEEVGATRFSVPLDEAREIQVRAVAPRVERIEVAGERVEVAVDFNLRSLENATRLRDLGLDLEAVLAPMAAEAVGASTAGGGYVRLSLSKPIGDALAGRAAPQVGDQVAPFETVETSTRVRLESPRRVEDHRDHALSMLSQAFGEMDDDAAPFEPHSELELARLKDGGVKTCEYCDLRLACRFRMAGGER